MTRPSIKVLREARDENAEKAFLFFAFEDHVSDHEFARRVATFNSIGRDLTQAINQLEEL